MSQAVGTPVLKTCARCRIQPPLTALWQVGFTIHPRWDSSQSAFVCSPLLVCGMCADSVSLDTFGGDVERTVQHLTGRIDGMDLVTVELRLDDISDGLWRDPSTGRGERVPIS